MWIIPSMMTSLNWEKKRKKKEKEKNPGYKNQGGEPIHQKYKANESMSGHNPKKQWKQTINPKTKTKGQNPKGTQLHMIKLLCCLKDLVIKCCQG
jgi:hypothetical protein